MAGITFEGDEADWAVDPFGTAAAIIREAVNKALTHQDQMSDREATILTEIHKEVS